MTQLRLTDVRKSTRALKTVHSLDHLLDEVDMLGSKVEKKMKPNYLAMSRAKNAKKNAFEDAEEARIKAELAAERCKGFTRRAATHSAEDGRGGGRKVKR